MVDLENRKVLWPQKATLTPPSPWMTVLSGERFVSGFQKNQSLKTNIDVSHKLKRKRD